MNRKTLEKRARFRLKERHLWGSQFRGGLRSVRVEWDRIQKMLAQLPLSDLPEYAQQWVWLLERTDAKQIAYHLRRGDFPYFDAWVYRLHVLDETMLELGYKLPARVPLIYTGYVCRGLAKTAQQVFEEAGGPLRFESATATAAASPEEPPAPSGAPPEGADPP